MDRLKYFFALFFGEALKALARNKTRNALAALGIMIGTAAVVCVVSIGQAGSARAEQQLRNLGDNLVWVEAGGRAVNGVRTGSKGTNTLVNGDLEAILAEVPQIKLATPNIDGHVQVAFGDRNWSTHYRGVGVDYEEIKNWPLASGSPLTESEVREAANVCILGTSVREQLFGASDPVGKQMRFGPLVCDVIGVLTSKGQAGFGQDQDDVVLLPWTTVARKVRGGKSGEYLDDILCSATSMQDVEVAATQITSLLRQRHHLRDDEANDFNIRRPDEVIKAEIQSKHTMAVFLISVAAVSLLVGGVGIMNVMLASVAERTREIGVRLAIGAKDWTVQAQFLGEAVTLSLAGGIAGAALGVIASLVLAHSLHWPITVPAEAVVLAPAFSVVTGIFFGFYPARLASKLDPITALRWE